MSTDTSPEFLMSCLARQVIADCRNTEDMRRWFSRWEKRHGAEARAELRAAVVAERERKAGALDLAPDEPEQPTDHEAHKAALLANRESYAVLAADDVRAAQDQRALREAHAARSHDPFARTRGAA